MGNAPTLWDRIMKGFAQFSSASAVMALRHVRKEQAIHRADRMLNNRASLR